MQELLDRGWLGIRGDDLAAILLEISGIGAGQPDSDAAMQHVWRAALEQEACRWAAVESGQAQVYVDHTSSETGQDGCSRHRVPNHDPIHSVEPENRLQVSLERLLILLCETAIPQRALRIRGHSRRQAGRIQKFPLDGAIYFGPRRTNIFWRNSA